MFLIVGLGNPGEKLKNTRHNIGRELLQEWQKQIGFADFSFDKKLNALISENPFRTSSNGANTKTILLLPETFVNKSGNALIPAIRRFKIKPEKVVVIHDDADIELGRTKLTYNRSSAGHKGVDSVRRALKTEKFWRIRVGIQKKKRVEAMKLVLQKFTPAEQTILKKIKKKIFAGLSQILEKGIKIAMNEINQN